MQPVPALRFRRLLLTGAAGQLGRELRPRLKAYCDVLRVSDRAEVGEARPGEEVMQASLEDRPAVFQLLEDVNAVVHLGGVSTEQSWESILSANIDGMVNLYESARRHRVPRIVFASSNHVTGMYRQDEIITPEHAVRPDGLYGLSKAFGENLAQLYWNRYGIETVSLRIGSFLTEPQDRRGLSTWISHDDTERLITAALSAPNVGHTVIYGASDNRPAFWDNTSASHIGYRPQDRSDRFRPAIEALQPTIDINPTAACYQGGNFVNLGPYFADQEISV